MRRTGLSQYPITFMNGLGVVATGRRSIYTGSKWDSFYPNTSQVSEKKIGFGDSYLTLDQMATYIAATHGDAAKIADRLYNPSLELFTKAIFDHIYQNFQYKLDPNNREQVKGVRGSYANRITGIDCDDMAFLAGAILYHKGIPFALRKIAMDATGDFSHVYVVVPKSPGLSLSNRSNYWAIDPVLDRWDYEYPKNATPRYFHDHLITPKSTAMNGLGCACQMGSLEQYDLNTKSGWETLSKNLRNGTEPAPEGDTIATATYKVALVLLNWENSVLREATIAELAAIEDQAGLDGMGGFIKKGVKGIGKAGQAVGGAIGDAAQAVGKAVVQAGQAIATVFPLTLLAREGIKLWFSTVNRDKAAALWPGLYTPEQAKALGIVQKDYLNRVSKWNEVRKLFNSIGGDGKNLAEAIHDGATDKIGRQPWYLPFDTVWNKLPVTYKPLTVTQPIPTITFNQASAQNLQSGVAAWLAAQNKPAMGGLGEPATVAASAAAAAPFIVKLTTLLANVNATVETVKNVSSLTDLLPEETQAQIDATIANINATKGAVKDLEKEVNNTTDNLGIDKNGKPNSELELYIHDKDNQSQIDAFTIDPKTGVVPPWYNESPSPPNNTMLYVFGAALLFGGIYMATKSPKPALAGVPTKSKPKKHSLSI